ncbi:MAG TPA: hypothetical protein VJO72_17555, partial [Candidatus Dormibacteraeota bacterium]|nr:hypothetical protein [Candidatus Dormibacteraeota bacterium]
LACDAALTRITGRGELEAEISHASRASPRPPGGRWKRAIGGAWPAAAIARRSGPTATTSNTGLGAG